MGLANDLDLVARQLDAAIVAAGGGATTLLRIGPHPTPLLITLARLNFQALADSVKTFNGKIVPIELPLTKDPGDAGIPAINAVVEALAASL